MLVEFARSWCLGGALGSGAPLHAKAGKCLTAHAGRVSMLDAKKQPPSWSQFALNYFLCLTGVVSHWLATPVCNACARVNIAEITATCLSVRTGSDNDR